MTLCILGRQSKLSLAELERVFGADVVSVANDTAAIVDLPAEEVTSKHLGGSIKIAKCLHQLQTTQWSELVDYICEQIPDYLQDIPEGKVKFGLSTYGIKVHVKELERSGLTIKKVMKKAGRSVRVVPNTDLALNSAQVLHNKLTSPTGIELLFIRSGSSTWLAQTVAIQDVESYTFRDRGRPMRDAKVGMLPPKLAQIMINLATGGGRVTPGGAAPENVLPKQKFSGADQAAGPADIEETVSSRDHDRKGRILDPFCGTGVVLQEAALMGYAVYGTDLDERMVRYTRDNINWFQDKFHMRVDRYYHQADAKNATWQQPIGAVVCESYLGTPFPYEPYPDKLRAAMDECDEIIRAFLKNLSGQVKTGSQHCIGVPAWFVDGSVHHLPLLNDLTSLGYERVQLTHADQADLIYHREGQVVGRELLVLKKK